MQKLFKFVTEKSSQRPINFGGNDWWVEYLFAYAHLFDLLFFCAENRCHRNRPSFLLLSLLLIYPSLSRMIVGSLHLNLCHCLHINVYKYGGVIESRVIPDGSPGHMYYMRVSVRFFAASLSVTLYCPLRRTAWRMRTEVFDYRAAQTSGALQPRDGEWYSRCGESFWGDLERLCPRDDTSLPGNLDILTRVSWWPAHFTVTFISGDSYHKISARPREGTCEWFTTEFSDDVFDDADIHRRFPRMFDTVPVVAPPRPDSTANTTPSPQEVTEEKKATEEPKPVTASGSEQSASDHGKNDWWAPWQGQEWSGNWWSPNVPPGTDFGVEKPWSESTDSSPIRSEPVRPAFVPEVSPIPEVEPVTISSPSPQSSSYVTVPEVTCQSPTDEPQPLPVTVSRQGSTEDFARLLSLHQMALTGPPLSREDRLARQVIANQLSLTPEVYNSLVFGENPVTEVVSSPAEPANVTSNVDTQSSSSP